MSATTRLTLLTYIVEHGGATIAGLAAALGLADATVRRHLDKLAADGLATSHTVRQHTGRPYLLYEATPTGVRQERDRSSELLVRLIGDLKRRSPNLHAVAVGMVDQLVAAHRQEVNPGGSLEERVQSTVAVLRDEGILDDWQRTPLGFALQNHACPYAEAATASDCVCESERLAIEQLVGAAVVQTDTLAAGGQYCEYVVQEPATAGPTRGEPNRS
jgi:predicted ArsR family transcriptional regulator